jgi:hypothetical protein
MIGVIKANAKLIASQQLAGNMRKAKTPVKCLELPADEHFRWDTPWQGLKAQPYSTKQSFSAACLGLCGSLPHLGREYSPPSLVMVSG